MSGFYPSGCEGRNHSRLGWDAARRVGAFIRGAHPITSDEGLPMMQEYELLGLLGRGAAGSVYLATRPGSDEQPLVAVKLFSCGLGDSAAARVQYELELLSGLRHPSVPRIHDYGTDAGRFYIATDAVDGERLDTYCESRSVDRDDRVELIIKVGRAVQQLHEFGIIHRDLKPGNIMLTNDGDPVIVDLGIAALLDRDQADSITTDGSPIGSPGFMAPEQARGERETISIRSDVYALGATACCLLTGATPHDVDAPLHEAIRRIAEDPPRPPLHLDPNLPKPLAAIIAKATAHDPNDRFASASEFVNHLEKWRRREPIGLANPSIFQRAGYRIRSNPWLSAATAIAALAFLAAVYLGTVAAAEARLADEQAAIAHEQAQLAREQEAFREEATQYLRRMRDIVARFIDDAEAHAGRGQYGQALALLLAIDKLLEGDAPDKAELAERHRTIRTDVVVKALRAVYRTDELGGDEWINAAKDKLLQLEYAQVGNN